MFTQIFVHSILCYLASSFIQSSIFLSLSRFFFSYRTLVTRVPTVKITQLVSLDLHSRDISACVLLDSREKVVKRVKVLVNTWNDVYERFFSDFQCRYDNYPLVAESGVNLSHCILCWIFPKENFLLYFIVCIVFFAQSSVYFRSTPFHGKMRAVQMHVVCLI